MGLLKLVLIEQWFRVQFGLPFAVNVMRFDNVQFRRIPFTWLWVMTQTDRRDPAYPSASAMQGACLICRRYTGGVFDPAQTLQYNFEDPTVLPAGTASTPYDAPEGIKEPFPPEKLPPFEPRKGTCGVCFHEWRFCKCNEKEIMNVGTKAD